MRYPAGVWRQLQLLALDRHSSATVLAREALATALDGDAAELVEASRAHRNAGGRLTSLELPIPLYRKLRTAAIEFGSTGQAIILAAIYAVYPDVVPPTPPAPEPPAVKSKRTTKRTTKQPIKQPTKRTKT